MSQDREEYSNAAEEREALDDIPAHDNSQNNIGEVLARRYGRRRIISGLFGAIAGLGASGMIGRLLAAPLKPVGGGIGLGRQKPSFNFAELQAGVDGRHHVAAGHEAEILIRWGDPIFTDAPKFDPYNQTADTQLQQFGYNNDYIGFLPLDDAANGKSTRGLLCVNHEYTNEEMMFAGLGVQDRNEFAGMTRDLVDIEMAAHGGTIIEIKLLDGKWLPDLKSSYNRRITPLTTHMSLDGPAAGHDRLKTSEDATGRHVIGTLNNCAGGMTPWGTYLMAEENFHFYFWAGATKGKKKRSKNFGGNQAKSYRRYKLGTKKKWPGGVFTNASISTLSQMKRTASAGWSRSTRWTRIPAPSSTPPLVASAMRGRNARSQRLVMRSSIWVTTHGLNISTGLSRKANISRGTNPLT